MILKSRWSAIASKLPGRTDNEIKNIWHTYLKKRVNCPNSSSFQERKRKLKTNGPKSTLSSNITITTTKSALQSSFSADQFSNSSSGTTTDVSSNLTSDYSGDDQYFLEIPAIDETFWSEELFQMEENTTKRPRMDLMESEVMHLLSSSGGEMNDEMDFWLTVLLADGNST